ncbi:hypothetical protein E4U53_002398 [Claviceps sorghi]|nr:hypothetical protein E4U53_002398 [Claviceps sorghi]
MAISQLVLLAGQFPRYPFDDIILKMGDSTRHVARSAPHPVGKHPNRAHPPRPGLRESPLSPRPTADEEETRASRVEAFSKWLAGVVPVHLVPGDLAEMLQHGANRRFDMARAQGVPVEQIEFGQDCLPTWATLCWDPDKESLHSVLQERLCDLGHALELDPVLQDEIRTKSNARMKEARQLGIPLDAIAVGPSLLPEWDMDPDAAETVSTHTSTLAADWSSAHGGEEVDHLSMPWTGAAGKTPETSFADGAPGELEVLDVDAGLERLPLRKTVDKRKRCSESSDPTSEDEDESSHGGGGEGEDDTGDIYLNNHVSPQPIYDDYATSNMVYDVQVVGGPGEACKVVDLEVYLAVGDDADDDGSYEDLAEVELAIDRAAYEECFGDDGAIDVHMPGADIFCFNRIEELDDEQGRESREEQDTEAQADDSPEETTSDVRERDWAVANGHVELEDAISHDSETSEEA